MRTCLLAVSFAVLLGRVSAQQPDKTIDDAGPAKPVVDEWQKSGAKLEWIVRTENGKEVKVPAFWCLGSA